MSYFFLYQSPSLTLCTVFDTISSKIDEVLLINTYANAFVFGDFNLHQKDWITYCGGTDRPGELCYNFSISNDLNQMVNFHTHTSLTVTLTILLFCIYLFLLYSFYNGFLSIAKLWSCCCVSFHWLLIKFTADVLFHCIAYGNSCGEWDGLQDHLGDVP